VAIDKAAELKKTVILLLQKRHDEIVASNAASNIASSPPYSSSVRKIKVSDTEMCDLSLGILTEIREPSPRVKPTKKRNRKSIVANGALDAAHKTQAAPPSITAII